MEAEPREQAVQRVGPVQECRQVYEVFRQKWERGSEVVGLQSVRVRKGAPIAYKVGGQRVNGPGWVCCRYCSEKLPSTNQEMMHSLLSGIMETGAFTVTARGSSGHAGQKGGTKDWRRRRETLKRRLWTEKGMHFTTFQDVYNREDEIGINFRRGLTQDRVEEVLSGEADRRAENHIRGNAPMSYDERIAMGGGILLPRVEPGSHRQKIKLGGDLGREYHQAKGKGKVRGESGGTDSLPLHSTPYYSMDSGLEPIVENQVDPHQRSGYEQPILYMTGRERAIRAARESWSGRRFAWRGREASDHWARHSGATSSSSSRSLWESGSPYVQGGQGQQWQQRPQWDW